MTKLLTLKHWQLFGLLMGIPMIFQLMTIGPAISSSNAEIVMYVFPMMTVLFIGLFFGWLYALGTHLHKKLPLAVNMNLNRFKIFLLIPFAYMLFLSVFMSGILAEISSGGEPNPAIFALIVPLHLFSMFCICYCFYFNAKALKTIEWQRPVTFSDFAGEFFLIWFFPIGVWILQPRINQLFDTNMNTDNNQLLDSDI